MLDILTSSFMLRALAAGSIVGILSGFYGTFIVQRKMSFLGSGLSHAAFGGVALGLLLNQEPLLIAVPFTILVSILIVFLKEKTNLGADTSIGILFSLSVALGIVFLALKEGYAADAFTYLFGSILSVSMPDIWVSLIMLAVTVIAAFKFWKSWAYSSFDAELAQTDKVNVLFEDYMLSVLIAATIVISIKIVGIVLIAAYLVIPAAAARLISKTFWQMTLWSVCIGITGSIAGLIVSSATDLPAGAVIIIVQTLIFLFFAVLKKK